MPREYVAIVAPLLLVAACWFVPLVRVVPLDKALASTDDFDPQAVAAHLFTDALPATFAEATDAGATLKLLQSDPDSARSEYGITTGVSRGFMLYLHGTGQVLSIDKQGVAVGTAGEQSPQFVLHTGMVFDTAVRDATRMFSSDDAPSTEMYNVVSDKLNQLVEQHVITKLAKDAGVGKSIEFVGCVNVKDPANVTLPLVVIPVSVTFESNDE